MKVTFYTKLSIDECILRIKENPKNVEYSNRFVSLFNYDLELFYKLNSHQVRLEKAIISRNVFKPTFYGTFVKSSKGTLLKGVFKKNPLGKVFFILSFGFIFLTGIGGQLAFIFLPNAEGSPIGLFLVTVLFTCIGILFYKLMIVEANEYEKQTIQFIEKTIVAKVQNDSTGIKAK